MGVKYFFKNIGPIKEAEMELGDLTIIAGKNNTGKTYLAYVLYGFLQFLREQGDKISRPSLLLSSLLSPRRLEGLVDDISRNTVVEEDGSKRVLVVREKVDQYVKRGMIGLTAIFSREINTLFSTSDSQFKGVGIDCKLDGQFDLTSNKEYSDGFVNSIKMNLVEKDIYQINAVSNVPMGRGLGSIIGNFILCLFLIKKFPPVFILSSERFGISLFYKELDFAKNRLVEELQRISDRKRDKGYNRNVADLERSSARYAKPIKDNIDFTRDLEHIQKQKGDLADHKFFDDIKDMMGGYYRYANNEIQFISKRRGENGFNIPLHIASSSARGLSDLYFYIKHVARKGQLLIIDEPESHLDTANQILIARLLARCVNAGIKVLITTHSDYIIKEFNNLIMLSHNFDGKEQFLKRYKRKYTENDHLSPESVKGYTCEKGKLKGCDVTKHGIDMPIFDETIRDINDVSNILGLSLDE